MKIVEALLQLLFISGDIKIELINEVCNLLHADYILTA